MNLWDIKYFFRSLFWKRTYRYLWQKITRGFSDQVTWNLDYDMAKWILPRLKRFKELNNGYPDDLTSERWDEILDEMIWAFNYIANDGEGKIFTADTRPGAFEKEREQWKAAEKRVDEALKLFGEYFQALWW